MHSDLRNADYDVVVVGLGAAGVCAAIAAAEKGARVLAVDRGLGGGASALSGGVVYAGGGTAYQKAAGHDDDPDNMYNYLSQEVRGVVDDDTLPRFCDGSVERLAWLEKHCAQFDSSLCDYKTSYPTDAPYLYYSGNEKAFPYNRFATPAPRGHRQVAKGISSGRVLWERLRDSALGLSVAFLPMTRADELLIDDDRVRGIRCRTVADDRSLGVRRYCAAARLAAKLTNWAPPIGEFFNHRAEHRKQRLAQQRIITAPHVILAAGGFVFNRDLARLHAPDYDRVSPLGTAADDGKGIALGVSAGGATDHMDRLTAWRFLSPPSALLGGVSVGINGQRIANEDLYGATHVEVMIREFGGRGFLVLDSAMWRPALTQLQEQTQPFQRAQMAWVFIVGHRKAATLPELARKLGVSQSGLLATVSAYNGAIDAGREDPAHKAAELCAPISQRPFYGIDISVRPSLTYPVPGLTLGGLKVDGRSGQVLAETGTGIRGLYAAGRTAVGICSNSYVSGLALADCVVSGRRAGEHAATNRRAWRGRRAMRTSR